MRFLKCLVLVALVHMFAAAIVFGAYHFTKAGNQHIADASSDGSGYSAIAAVDLSTEQKPQTVEESAALDRKHVVRSGENYWTIAQKYEVAPRDLMKVNGHQTGHVLKAGEVLQIPK